MKNYRQLVKELPSKAVVFAFGRFNPPTIGHELLFKVVQKLAKSHNAAHVIYASRTQDKKKNPLTVDKKVKYLKLMFKGMNFVAANDEERTFLEAVKSLNSKYKNLIMVAGSDRVAEYDKLLNTYNGKNFHYDTIQVVSAGERDPDADDASGMSASKMRTLATKGNYTEFKKGLPSTVRDIDGRKLMNDIRQASGLEAIKEDVKFTIDVLRDKYFKGEIYHIGEIVESAGQQYEIVDRGSNYLVVVDQTGNLHRKWIKDVNIVEVKNFKQFNESVLNPKDPHKDYREKSKNLHDLSLNKDVDQKAVTQRKLDLDKEYSKYKINEDIQPGYAPKEISYKGYTTKNLHHSTDAAKAFQSTIDRANKGLIPNDPVAILNALKSTDTYMKLNDLHLQQGKKPNSDEIKTWIDTHDKAKQTLDKLGEFPHHLDYWTSHKSELQMMGADYAEHGKGEMTEELTNKTVKPNDKLKVARILADMLGVDKAESSSSPEQLINTGLRKLKSKTINKDLLNVVHKMLNLADEVGIKYDASLKPQKLKEDAKVSDNLLIPNPKHSNYNLATDVLRYSDYMKLKKYSDLGPNKTQIGDKEQGIVEPHRSPGHSMETDSHLRRRKVKYSTEQVEPGQSLVSGSDDEQVRRRKVKYSTEEKSEHLVHVSDGSKYDEVPHPKDIEHIKKHAAMHGGKWHSHSDKGAFFKFPSHEDAKNFINHANKAPHKTVHAELTEADDIKVYNNAKNPVKDDSKMQNSIARKITNTVFEENEEHDISEKDLDDMVDSIKDVEDVLDAYDEDELAIVDHETGEEIKEEFDGNVIKRGNISYIFGKIKNSFFKKILKELKENWRIIQSNNEKIWAYETKLDKIERRLQDLERFYASGKEGVSK
jgi:nicotinic acid mononucleotide adenylyltransferase